MGGGGYYMWSNAPPESPAPTGATSPATTGATDPMNAYVGKDCYITCTGRISCDRNSLSVQTCTGSAMVDLWGKGLDQPLPKWRIDRVPGTTDQFYLSTSSRGTCSNVLSVSVDCANTSVDTWGTKGPNQTWQIRPVLGAPGAFTVESKASSRATCRRFLSVSSVCGEVFVDLWTADEGSGMQRWKFEVA